jgi:RNA polymerase-associated protein LEO1
MQVRQSNSRIVRWSDGSLSLRLGSELFDITQTVDTSAATVRSTLGPAAPTPPGAGKGLTYLVQQHKRAFVLQAEATLTGTMTLRPTGMQSEAHRALVRAVGQRHSRVARLRLDADAHGAPEPPKSRPRARRAPRDADAELGADPARKARRSAGKSRRRRADDVFTDEDDDEEEAAYSADESPRRRAGKADAGDERRGGEYQPDDFLVADSDGGGSDDDAAPRARRRARDEPASEDELDRLDAQIAQQQKKRKTADGGADADAEGEEEARMDVESEEEDDDFKVRKAGAGGGGARRKRAFEVEEEEDD